MSSNNSFGSLSGGRFLASLYAKDSLLAAMLQRIINSVNKTAANAGVGSIDEVAPPPPINNINIKTSGEYLNVSLNHNASVNRGINYFVEVSANDPDFKQPVITQPLGPSRTAQPMLLPTYDDNGNLQSYYVRAYAQYPGSKPSRVNTFGGANSATPISMGGNTMLTLLAGTGSGTASPTGQQGASGFGKNLTSPKLQGAITASIGAPSQNQSAPIVTPPTPTPTQVTDDIIHGDAIWWIDPAFNYWRDDFMFHGTITGVSGTDTHGELRWDSGGNAVLIQPYNGAAPHFGQFQIQNNNIAGDYFYFIGPCLKTGPGYLTSGFALLEKPNWKMIWIFNFSASPNVSSATMTQTSLYVGLACPGTAGTTNLWNPALGPSPRPPYFLGCRFDTDTTSPSIGDATLKLEMVGNANTNTGTRNNTQGTVFDTGIAPSLTGNWCALEITCTATGMITMSVTDDLETSLCPRSSPQTFTAPTMTCTAGDHSAAWTVAAGVTGLMTLVQSAQGSDATAGATNFCWGNGSEITLAGLSSTLAVYNGTYIVQGLPSATNLSFLTSDVVTGTANSGAAVSGYPTLLPFFTFGNDTTASPVANRAFAMDFFGLVWNPGVDGGTGTPNPAKSRYW